MLSNARALSFALIALVPLAACGSNVTGGLTKEEARELNGIDPDGNDICALEGWYGDEECDDFCVEADPDCPVSNCPDPNDPAVHYMGDPAQCQVIDYACGEGSVAFESAECGCGCIDQQPPGAECGGIAGLTCQDGQFCEFPVSTTCGATDQLGHCKDLPQACPEIYAPVCGCDGITYSSACDANGHGQSILHEGTCETGPSCGGIVGELCQGNTFCNLDYQCGTDDAQGTCEPLPEACPDIWDPVCSCTGVTFSNLCDAHAQGASVAYDGACQDPTVISCGSGGDAACPSDQFCNYTLQAMCGFTDALGYCDPIPTACPDVWDPVCGCDNVTYSNECDANAQGVAVLSGGACELAFD